MKTTSKKDNLNNEDDLKNKVMYHWRVYHIIPENIVDDSSPWQLQHNWNWKCFQLSELDINFCVTDRIYAWFHIGMGSQKTTSLGKDT